MFTTVGSERKISSRRLWKAKVEDAESSSYDAQRNKDIFNRMYSPELYRNISASNNSDALLRVTDTNENRISSTVYVKRIKRADLNQLEDVEGRLKENLSQNDHASVVRSPTVGVIRVSKADLAKSSHSHTTKLAKFSATSTVQTMTPTEVKVIRIPRNQAANNQHPRSLSAHSVGVLDIDANIIKIKPMKTKLCIGTTNRDIKQSIGNGVTIRKISKSAMTFRSLPS